MTTRTRPTRPARGPHLRRGGLVAAATVAVLAVLAGCSDDADPAPAGSATAAPSATADPESSSAPGPTAQPDEAPTVAEVTATVSSVVATGLAAPWGLAPLPDGGWLVTQRDARTVLLLDVSDPAATRATELGGEGAQDLRASTTGESEAGLLGVAVSPGFAEDRRVYLYRTGEDGNEVLWGELSGTTLGPLTAVLTGIPAAANHNGGQLAFGPDGFLYVSTGDAGVPADAQDPDSLAGKILRVTGDGAVPAGNPVPGSPMWSLGHRNVQGLGWAPDGRMFASEFGQSSLDELNLVVAGGNYGWPAVEGPGGASDGFVDPLLTWPTSQASPSGLAVTDEGVYLAGLRGERLWRAPLAAQGVGEPQELLAGTAGRLRAVVQAADGHLAVLTNNTDGRGEPREGDDQLLLVQVDPVS